MEGAGHSPAQMLTQLLSLPCEHNNSYLIDVSNRGYLRSQEPPGKFLKILPDP
jgi:hypothetical protein